VFAAVPVSSPTLTYNLLLPERQPNGRSKVYRTATKTATPADYVGFCARVHSYLTFAVTSTQPSADDRNFGAAKYFTSQHDTVLLLFPRGRLFFFFFYSAIKRFLGVGVKAVASQPLLLLVSYFVRLIVIKIFAPGTETAIMIKATRDNNAQRHCRLGTVRSARRTAAKRARAIDQHARRL